MKSFKDFSNILIETTVPDELKHIPAQWHHHSKVSEETKQKMLNAMNGKLHTTFALDDLSPEEPDADVAEHLDTHGYKIHDYSKGIATKLATVGTDELGYKQKIIQKRIGSILEETKAPLHVKSAYMNDPARQAAKKSNLHVCITSTPNGVAGMTVGTKWANESCMNLKSGGYKHKLEDDSENGTHVAYLVHSHDAGISHGEPFEPIARIALKPYHATEHGHDPDPTNDTIFRAEDRTYGADSSKFANAVNQWAEKKYPAITGQRYQKNDDVYDDTDNTAFTSKTNSQIENDIDRNNGRIDLDYPNTIPIKQLDHAISYVNDKHLHNYGTVNNFIESASELDGLSNSHIRKLYDMANVLQPTFRQMNQHYLAQRHGDKFTTRMIEHYADTYGGVDKLPGRILKSKKMPDSLIDQLSPTSYGHISSDRLKPHHIDKLVDYMVANNSSRGAMDNLDSVDRMNSDHLKKIADNVSLSGSVLYKIMAHPAFDETIHNKILARSPIAENALLRKSPYAKFDKETMTDNNSFRAIVENEHISDANAKEIKDSVVNNDLQNFVKLSNKVGQHLTKDDYKKISTGRVIEFANPKHSNKLLDAQRDAIHDAHDALTDHLAEADPTNEQDIKKRAELTATLKHRMQDYTGTMEDHINSHVRGSDEWGDVTLKDADEWNNVNDRFHELKALKHFRTIDGNFIHMNHLHRMLKAVAP